MTVIVQEPYSLPMDDDSYSTGTLQSINGRRQLEYRNLTVYQWTTTVIAQEPYSLSMDDDSYSTGTLVYQWTTTARVQEPYSLPMDDDSYSTGTLQSINGR